MFSTMFSRFSIILVAVAIILSHDGSVMGEKLFWQVPSPSKSGDSATINIMSMQWYSQPCYGQPTSPSVVATFPNVRGGGVPMVVADRQLFLAIFNQTTGWADIALYNLGSNQSSIVGSVPDARAMAFDANSGVVNVVGCASSSFEQDSCGKASVYQFYPYSPKMTLYATFPMDLPIAIATSENGTLGPTSVLVLGRNQQLVRIDYNKQATPLPSSIVPASAVSMGIHAGSLYFLQLQDSQYPVVSLIQPTVLGSLELFSNDSVRSDITFPIATYECTPQYSYHYKSPLLFAVNYMENGGSSPSSIWEYSGGLISLVEGYIEGPIVQLAIVPY